MVVKVAYVAHPPLGMKFGREVQILILMVEEIPSSLTKHFRFVSVFVCITSQSPPVACIFHNQSRKSDT